MSLTDKRKHHYEYTRTPRTSVSLGNIEINADEVENKLDSVITNTLVVPITGNIVSVLGGGATVNSSPIDIGLTSGVYKVQWAGTESVAHLDYTLMVSSDNITYHPFHSVVALRFGVGGGTISLEYNMVFRYHKLKIVNTDAAVSATVDLVYSSRH